MKNAVYPQRAIAVMLFLALITFTACNRTSQDKHLVKQQFDELSNDLKMTKSQIADLELEVEVLTNQLQELTKKNSQQASADPQAMRDLSDRVISLETRNADLEKTVLNFEKKVGEGMKDTPRTMHVPASLKKEDLPAASEPDKGAQIANLTPPGAPERKEKAEAPAVKAAPATSRGGGIYYTVKKGETLKDIAAANKVPESRLRSINNLRSGNPLVNQRLWIPR